MGNVGRLSPHPSSDQRGLPVDPYLLPFLLGSFFETERWPCGHAGGCGKPFAVKRERADVKRIQEHFVRRIMTPPAREQPGKSGDVSRFAPHILRLTVHVSRKVNVGLDRQMVRGQSAPGSIVRLHCEQRLSGRDPDPVQRQHRPSSGKGDRSSRGTEHPTQPAQGFSPSVPLIQVSHQNSEITPAE